MNLSEVAKLLFWFQLLKLGLVVVEVTAPFGEPILGWFAGAQIRHSAGATLYLAGCGFSYSAPNGLIFGLASLSLKQWSQGISTNMEVWFIPESSNNRCSCFLSSTSHRATFK
jgi:hypothetical protein